MYHKSIVLKSNENYKICTRCICDTTIPGIKFNKSGICSFCTIQDRMEKEYPIYEVNDKFFRKLANRVRTNNKKSEFDCICGVSGGRDSMYTLYFLKNILKLNPLAVHFNDGFGNPVAGENIIKGCQILNVKLRTVTSDWRESKDIRKSFLKASTPDLGTATDIGIAAALYGTATKENLKYIFIGQSFRTEGIAPLLWNYLDGKYVKDVLEKFGTVKLRKWRKCDPGFNLGLMHMFYYICIKRIRTIPILYNHNYIRKEVDVIIKSELEWKDTGAHYFDDLYQSLMTYVLRNKFNIDRRIFSYSALIRSGQINRNDALDSTGKIYNIEDQEIINLCLKRLSVSESDFQNIMSLEPKTFLEYKSYYNTLKLLILPIYFFSKINILPGSTYRKYFNFI